MVREPDTVELHLAAARDRFLAFVRRRISDPDLAEDVLQEAYARAIASAPPLEDEERIAAWFYRVLRNAIIDAYRRNDVRQRRQVPLGDIDVPEVPSDSDDRVICECFRELLPALNADYADLIERIELGGESTQAAAERLGITTNNVNVRRHRARRALRARLEETCRLCATHGCLDCTCDDDGDEV